jgi:PRC-barrel domain
MKLSLEIQQRTEMHLRAAIPPSAMSSGTWAGHSRFNKGALRRVEASMAKATAHPDHQLISSEDVEGTAVYDSAGKKIGTIDHLMIEKISGRITHAVMSFGGVLGLGHSHHPLSWSLLKYNTALGGYETNVTGDQLKDMPAFSDDDSLNSRRNADTQINVRHFL